MDLSPDKIRTTRTITIDWIKIKDCTPEDSVYEKIEWVRVEDVDTMVKQLREWIENDIEKGQVLMEKHSNVKSYGIGRKIGLGDALIYIDEVFGVEKMVWERIKKARLIN